jgi:hypothetical protein
LTLLVFSLICATRHRPLKMVKLLHFAISFSLKRPL